jgi:hypothetical protein
MLLLPHCSCSCSTQPSQAAKPQLLQLLNMALHRHRAHMTAPGNSVACVSQLACACCNLRPPHASHACSTARCCQGARQQPGCTHLHAPQAARWQTSQVPAHASHMRTGPACSRISSQKQQATGLQLLHRLLQLAQSGALLLLLLLAVAGRPMQALQNAPPQPLQMPPDALAAPQPLQQGGETYTRWWWWCCCCVGCCGVGCCAPAAGARGEGAVPRARLASDLEGSWPAAPAAWLLLLLLPAPPRHCITTSIDICGGGGGCCWCCCCWCCVRGLVCRQVHVCARPLTLLAVSWIF